jgi:hypothetical protein
VSGPADLVFCDAASAGNTLKYEVATYDASSGLTEIYVLVSSLSHTTDTNIYMFYGNASVSTTQQDLSLWTDAGYQEVCHFPDGTTLNITCSKQAGTPVNHSAAAVAGQAGGAADFASGHYIDAGNSYSQGTSAFSVEAWFKKTSCASNFQAIASTYNTGTSTGWWLYVCDGSGQRVTFLNPANQNTANAAMPFSQWNYAVGTYNGSVGKGLPERLRRNDK